MSDFGPPSRDGLSIPNGDFGEATPRHRRPPVGRQRRIGRLPVPRDLLSCRSLGTNSVSRLNRHLSHPTGTPQVCMCGRGLLSPHY